MATKSNDGIANADVTFTVTFVAVTFLFNSAIMFAPIDWPVNTTFN